MKSLIVLMMVFTQLLVADAHAQRTASASGFVAYDGTLYLQKPDLTPFGLSPITVIYSASMWNSAEDRLSVPNAKVIRTLALQARSSTGIAVVDIESWPNVGFPAKVADSVQKYQATIQLFKQSAPSLRVGYYGVVPIFNYKDAISGSDSPGYRAWQATNSRIASAAQGADVLFPAIYTFYKDQDGWRKVAIAQIEEARRIAHGKPVYVFLWPQFDEAGKGGDYLPRDYWRMELETARQHADGVVIWGGWKQTWDNNAPWWLETQSFLKEIGSQK
jgi:Hyaluronidase